MICLPSRRFLAVVTVLLVLLGTGFVLSRPPLDVTITSPFTTTQMLASFQESGAQVTLTMEHDQQGTIILAALFTPLNSDSHLYSVDLPLEGIDGAGRPTKLEIPQGQIVRAVGPAQASQPVELRSYEGFSAAFPVYPDGPISIRIPIVGVSSDSATNTDVLISYMVCSSQGSCLPPVENRHIPVILAKQ